MAFWEKIYYLEFSTPTLMVRICKLLQTLMIWVLLRSKWSFDHEIKHAFFDKLILSDDVGDFVRIFKQLKIRDLLVFGHSEIPSFNI